MLSDEAIGENVRRLRGNVSQTELADRMRNRGHRWSQPTVVSVEKGERALRLTEAVDLAALLDAPIQMFAAPNAEVSIASTRRVLSDARSELQDAAARYDNARVEYKWAVFAAIDAGGVPNERAATRDDWMRDSPEDVIRRFRETSDALLDQESVDEYFDRVNLWSAGG